MSKPIYHTDAPFRKYKRTDEEAFAEGYKSGLEWRAHWGHIPGGPFVSKASERDCEDWKAYCRLLEHHRVLWLKGWRAGLAEAARIRPEIARLQETLILDRLLA